MKDHKSSLVRFLLVGLFALMIGIAPAYAQQVTGSITGTITDESKAVIPGAEVSIRNADTGAEATTTTGENGVFRVPALTPGNYTVSVMAPGFKRQDVTQVIVKLGIDTTIDVLMQVGAATDIVEVTGGEVLIERETAQISTNYDARKVADLPNSVAGGGVDTIALLTPGVVSPGDSGFSNGNGTNISSNGGRGRSNNFSIDGQDNNDISVAGPSVFITNADAVQEFQIVTNNFSAEYGQAGGAIVNLVTKGGTNEFHGTVSYFHRDRKLFDTLDTIDRRTGKKEADPLLNNTFGYTLGGPIVKDKLLFFTSYQGIRQASSTFVQSNGNGLTLTPNGIAQAKAVVSPAIASAIDLISPFNQPIGNPQIQSNVPVRLVTVMIGGRPVPLEFGAIQRNVPTPFEENLTTARLDYNISPKLRVFGRYLYQKQESGAASGRFTAGFIADVPSRSQQVGATIIYQVSNRAVNEFRVNYSRLRAFFGGGTVPNLGNSDQGIANFTLPSGFLATGVQTTFPQGRINDNYQFLDTFTLNLNKHTLKMGVDFKRRLTDSVFLPTQNGSFSFRTLEAFFNNQPDSVSLSIGPNVLNFTEFDQAYFFEDTYKVRENLTLTLGLRYENSGQPINILNELTSKREQDSTTAIFNQNLPLDQRVFPGVDTDNNNFAPRVGFAYSPKFAKNIFGDGKTVIRGAYGISYDLAFYNILINSSSSAPVVLSTTITPASAGGPLTGFIPAMPTGPNVRAALSPFLPLNRLDPRLLNRTNVSNDFHNPYTQQYSFGIQRQFGNNTVIEARYVGTHSVAQFASVNGNPRFDALARDFPQFVPAGVKPSPNGRLIANSGLLRTRINGADSNYNALQVRFDTRLKNQLTFGASYTYSKQIDNSSEIFGTGGGGNTLAFSQDVFNTTSGERALGAYDFRHNFSMNFIYDIPYFREQKGALGKALGGYSLSGTFRGLSGQRYTPVQFAFDSPYTDNAFNSAFAGQFETLRPFIGNPNADQRLVGIFDSSSPTGVTLLNDGSPTTIDKVRFIVNTADAARIFGTPYGNAGRNSLMGDETFVGNFALLKNTKVSERLALQFRAEFFNVFNHPNNGVPDPFVDDAGSTFADFRANPNGGAGGGTRTIQFGLKLIF